MINNFDIILPKTVRAVKKAARLMKGSFSSERKGDAANIVTSADKAIEAYLTKRLTQIIPCSVVLGEEMGARGNTCENVWVIDPIDGTMNFARGIDDCCISVALVSDGLPLMGVVYAPRTKRLYTAVRDCGAKCNGRPIHVSEVGFDEAILCTALSLYRKEHADKCMAVIGDAYRKCNDIRRFGSCALELCYIAEGKCDMLFEYRVFPWDHAGATIILREAGGMALAGDGSPLSYTTPQPLIAANSTENLNKLKDIVKSHIPEFPKEEPLIGKGDTNAMADQATAEKRFTPTDIESCKKPYVDIDLQQHYDKAFSELGLQQSKRDQLVTIYLAFLALIVPLCLKSESGLPSFAVGAMFMACALVGAIFSAIIVRYRVYKEIYWLCCQTISSLYMIELEKRTKETVQTVFYDTLMKKAKDFKGKSKKFSSYVYVKKSIFSAETLYYVIVALLTSVMVTLGGIFLFTFKGKLIVSILLSLFLFLRLMHKYFKECVKVYSVAKDGTDKSFNVAFKKAWFLHFFL